MMIEIDSYLEGQYNNRELVPEHPEFIDSWAKRSENWRKQTNPVLDIPYGAGAREVLDIFSVASNQGLAPVHVYLHGGYWQGLSKDWFSFVAETFSRQGECAVIVNYDLCPSVTLVQIVEQIQNATCWLIENISSYGGDCRSMTMTGHSAGGHLAAMLLTMDWSNLDLAHPPFQRINSLSGIFDLQPLVSTSINRALQLDESVAHALSPLFKSPWNPSPGLKLNLMVGGLESDEFKKQSQQLLEAWKDFIDVEYRELSGSHHFSLLNRFLETDW